MYGPPEVITGRLMSGAGAAPMLAASAQYTAAAAAFEASADRLMAQTMYLGVTWLGEAAQAMQITTVRHLAWMRVLQAQLVLAAARTADQAAAFSTAFTTMAQMPEIVENRVTTAVLHATNFLGVNTVPIAVREGQYQAMWAQDVAVQSAYFAATVANTTFEPFVPPLPMGGLTSFTPPINQALNAATSAADKVRLAADDAAAVAGILKGRLGLVYGTALDAAQQVTSGAKQAEAQAAVARYREHDLEQAANQPQEQAAEQMTQQMTQQLIQQLPQQAAQLGQQVTQLPQQAAQQLTQVGQQLTQVGQQFGSQIGTLMGQVAPQYQLDNPGFFDTHPSSPTLDALAAGSGGGAGGFGGAGAPTALLRVPSLGGLSGMSTGFRLPSGWDGAALAAAPTAPPPGSPGLAPAMAGRGMGGMPPPPLRRRGEDDEPATITRPDTELSPLWGAIPEEPDTVSAAELAHRMQEAAR